MSHYQMDKKATPQHRFILMGLIFVLMSCSGEQLSCSVAETASVSFKIAACPTWQPAIEQLSSHGMTLIRTKHTRDSFQLLAAGHVDMIIGGRVRAPNEPEYSFEVLGPGYSFMAARRISISADQLYRYRFFTDLPAADVMETFEGITNENLTVVQDVYEYLLHGIGITSPENTDYRRSLPVVVRHSDGTRHRYSRIPILYYRHGISDEAISLVRHAVTAKDSLLAITNHDPS
jgi:hypothetical protein